MFHEELMNCLFQLRIEDDQWLRCQDLYQSKTSSVKWQGQLYCNTSELQGSYTTAFDPPSHQYKTCGID